MKNLIGIFCAIIFISCEKALVENPRAIVAENFYRNTVEVESAVNGIIAPLRAYNGFGFLYPAQLSCYSDFTQGRGSYAPVSNFQGLDNTNITRTGQIWDQFYEGIRNANVVISHLTNNSYLSESDINHYMGEAKFFRAFTYFQIIVNWGKAVLRTEDNMLEQDVPLSDAGSVYKLIEDDLKFCEQNLPSTAKVPGRPTKGAAEALLSDVYFFQGKYSDALTEAKSIIESGTYSLVNVGDVNGFQQIYGGDILTSPEEIFYLKYSRLIDGGWSFVGFLNTATTGYYKSGGSTLWAIYIDTLQNNVYKNWDNRDLRKGLWYGIGDFGLGPNALLSSKFIDPKTIESGTDGGNDYPFYRYADILLLYAEAECRVNGISTDAIEKLNMVHRRAYGYNPLSPSSVDYKDIDFANEDQFYDAVLKEQGYESFLEGGKRWFNLKRLGAQKARDVILSRRGLTIADKHFLWPFPISEYNINKGINIGTDQNPGY